MLPLPAKQANSYYQRLCLCAVFIKDKPESHRQVVLEVRNVLEELFKLLCQKEKEVHETLYARMQAVFLLHQVPAYEINKAHELRRYANLVIHNSDYEIMQEVLESAMLKMAKLIHFFSGEEIPAVLKAYTEKPIEKPKVNRFTKNETLAELWLQVLSIDSKGPLLGKQQKPSTIIIGENEELGKVKVYCIDFDSEPSQKKKTHPANKLALFAKMLETYPGTSVYLENLETYQGNANEFVVNIQTNLVIAPDILLDVSDLASCIDQRIVMAREAEQWTDGENVPVQDVLLGNENRHNWIEYKDNPYGYFAKKLVGTDSNANFLKGVIVNALFDRLLFTKGEAIDFEEAFDKSVSDVILMALNVPDDKLLQIRNDIRNIHYPNLQRFVNDYFLDAEVLAEASFINPKYGLQGRPDVLRLKGERLDIFELKSTKAIKTTKPYPQHAAQVAGYKLLVEEVLGKDRIASGSLLYSGAEDTSGQFPVNLFNMSLQRLSNVRNTILYGLRQIAVNKADKLIQRIVTDPLNLEGFSKGSVLKLSGGLAVASPMVKAYYFEFLGFIVREFFSSKVGAFSAAQREEGGYADLWRLSDAQKMRQLRVISGLTLTDFNREAKLLRFTYSHITDHAFREGDLAVIYRNTHFGHSKVGDSPILKQQILKGSISTINDKEIYIRLRSELIPQSLINHSTHWCLEPDQMDGNYWNSIATLTDFLCATPDKHNLILGIKAPEVEPIQEIEFEQNCRLLPHQKDIVNQALAAKDYYLIQGPPGTGKTSTLLPYLVSGALGKGYKQITILAFTNKAIAEIEEALIKADLDYLLFGGGEEDEGKHPNRISFLKKGRSVADLREVVMGKKIILSTVATFNSRKAYLKDLITFEMVIVDEASQLLEPDLAGILIRYQKFVLIGDQNQLPAVVTQSDSFCMVENQEMQDAGLVDLRTSLFERLYRRCESEGWQGAIGMLTDHFRMHEDIACLVNNCYNNKLEAKLARQIAPWVAYYEGKNHKLYPLLSQKRVLFLESLTEAKRKINNSEAEMAVELVRFIKSYGKNEMREPYSIGIITPFRAQIALIMHQLHEKGLNDDVMVDTVERYQGQQRDIIILSMAANDLQSFQGLQSVNLTGEIDRKLVVSLSRAKEQLIILGNSEILGNAKPYELLLNQLKGCGNYISNREVQTWFPEIQSSKVANEQFLN